MRRGSKSITALLLAAAICMGLGACGTGEEGIGAAGGTNSLPSTVSVKTGAIATDSWGYSGAAAVQVAAPAKTEVVIKEHTLLMDPFQVVVSGVNFTRVSFSSDVTTLSAAARNSAPGTFVSYVDLYLGPARTAIPALQVTVDVAPIAAGEALTVYNYDAGSGKWISAQTAVVSATGTITFQADKMSLWAVFR